MLPAPRLPTTVAPNDNAQPVVACVGNTNPWRFEQALTMRSWSSLIALLLGSCLLAQEVSPVFRGNWTATADPRQVLRGTWAGQTLPAKPNAAQGSWTLLTETGEILLEGTWSAQKTRVGWQGAWTARTLRGRSFSGTWEANIANLSGKTFKEMLERTAEKEVAGAWRSGGYRGNWWLKSSPPRGRSR